MTSQPEQFANLVQNLNKLNVDKYTQFKKCHTYFKFIENKLERIRVDILIPNSIRTDDGPVPIIIRIHGGYLVTGSSLYPPWFSDWLLDYAVTNNAILVCPNYRLLPEVTGKEVLEDIDDFWKWLQDGNVDQALETQGYKGLNVDLDQVLVSGESAGGGLAVHLAMEYRHQVRAIIAAYPMLDLRSDFFSKEFPKPIVGVDNCPNSIINDHIQSQAELCKTQPHPRFLSYCDPPERMELSFAIIQNGRFHEFLGEQHIALFPLDRLDHEDDASTRLPPMFMFHGMEDSAVPVDGTIAFMEKLNKLPDKPEVCLSLRPGDHGFDAEVTGEEPWLRDGLAFVRRYWLGHNRQHGF